MANVTATNPGEVISVVQWPVAVGWVVNSFSAEFQTPDGRPVEALDPSMLSPCRPYNQALALNKAANVAPQGPAFRLLVKESLANAFLIRSESISTPVSADVRLPPSSQSTPGKIYNTESRFLNLAYPETSGMKLGGLATQASRFQVRFTAPSGFQIHAPVYEAGRTATNSRIRLIAADDDGGSAEFVKFGPHSSTLKTAFKSDHVYTYEVTDLQGSFPASMTLDTFDLPFYVATTGLGPQDSGTISANVSLAPKDSPGSQWLPRFEASTDVHRLYTVQPCPPQPNMRGLVTAKSGAANARVWTVRATNSGTGEAANAKLGGFTLKQSYGAACTPVVLSALPAAFGSIAPSGTALTAVTIDFSSCASTARFSATMQFTADGGYTASTTLSNQYR